MNVLQRAALPACLFLAGLAACGQPVSNAPAVDMETARAEVDAAMDSMLAAYAANDVEAYFGHFAGDATLMTNAGRIQPVAEYHDNWTKLIGGGGGVVTADRAAPRTIRVAPDGTTALALTAGIPVTYRYPDSANAGDFVTTDSVWTESITWAKVDGEWKIMHFHYHDARR